MGPAYRTPEMDLPAHYLQEEDNGELSNLNSWWENFQDPELDRLIQMAIDQNYDLAIAMERIEEARGKLRVATGELWPEIDFNATYQRSRISQNLFDSDFLGPPVQNYFQLGFDAIWELDFWGKLRRRREAALYEMESFHEAARDIYITLLSDVARTYTEIRALEKKQAVVKEKISVLRSLSWLSRARYEAGLADFQQVNSEEILLQKAEEELLQVETLLEQTLHRIAILLGIPPENLEWKEGGRIPFADALVKAGIPSDLLRRRPDIREAERNLAAATARIGEAVADLFPSLSLTGDANMESNRSSKLFKWSSRSWAIGPAINWPLLTFGRIRGNIDVKNAIEREALYQYKNRVILALEDVENALVAYFNQQEIVKAKKEELLFSKDRSELENNLYESGISNFSSYLEEKRAYLDIRSEEIDERKNLTIDLISLYKALGGGW